MQDKDKQEAAELAARAATQAKHAGQNAARSVDTVAEAAAADVAAAGHQAARRISPRGLSAIAGDMGVGFFALSVCLYSGALAFSKFDAAFRRRGR